MKFVVGVVDKMTNKTIIEGAHATHEGVTAILENFTILSMRERNSFLREVIGKGVCAYEPTNLVKGKPYAITTMRL